MSNELDPKDLEVYVWRSFAILGLAGILVLGMVVLAIH
jgi:hypothetical protein